jgi:Flp pilus assembly protein CpaB
MGSSRRPIIAGAAALILATILLLVYLSHYRNSVKSSNSSASVLVAQTFIKKGTNSIQVAKNGGWEITQISKDELKPDAVSDAAVFKDQVALDDIYPGQQLTVSDFGTTATSTSLSASPILLGEGRRSGTWRALSIPLDTSHGISPQAVTGDHVDVYLQNGGTLTLLMPDVLILAAPGQAAQDSAAPTSDNYILRVPVEMVPRFMFAADNTKLWFALRPQEGAKPPTRLNVTSANVVPFG